jgi:hypothetical protein
MKKFSAGQIASLIANLGVVASIVFLVLELRITNSQATISTTQEMNFALTDWQLSIAEDSVVLDTYIRGLQDFESLDETETARFDFLMRSLLERVDMAIDARESGLVRALAENLEDRGLEGKILRVAGEPGFRAWWQSTDRRGLPPTIIPITEQLIQISSN